MRPIHLYTGGKGAVGEHPWRRWPSHTEQHATETRGEEEVRKTRSENWLVNGSEDLGLSPGEGGGEHVTGGV